MSFSLGSLSSVGSTDMGQMLSTKGLHANLSSEDNVRNGATSQGRLLQMINKGTGNTLSNTNNAPKTLIKSAFKGNEKLLSATEKIMEKSGIGTISGVLGKVGGISGILSKFGNMGNVSGVFDKIGGMAGTSNNISGLDPSSIVKSAIKLF
jgi:hypothetical protein